MMRYDGKIGIAFSLVMMLGLTPVIPYVVSAQQYDVVLTGPYIDQLEFHVITQDDQQALALQDGEIDLIGDRVDPTYLEALNESTNIEVVRTLKNGYGYFTINTQKYPFNITAFRRAMAFAIDKEKIVNELWSGLAEPQDSAIPAVNPLSIENDMEYHYYQKELATANELLDNAGFTLNESTGYRMAPNGSELHVVVAAGTSSQISEDSCEILKNALLDVNVSAEVRPAYFDGWVWDMLYYHGNYDIIFIGAGFDDFDVSWLAYEYWTEYADEPSWNYPAFRNSTYDSYREALIHSTDYNEVVEASNMMQQILCYECPIIVAYENYYLSAYRTNRYEGHVNSILDCAYGWWTNYKVHHVDEGSIVYGGTFHRSASIDIETLSIFQASSRYTLDVLNELYDSLFVLGPNGEDVPWLVEAYNIQTHADDSSVMEGHTRFEFTIRSNFQWSDGTPLTAEDIADTFKIYYENEGLPYHSDIHNMTAAYTRNPTTLVVEFNTESYWHFHSIAYVPILPSHIFHDMTEDDLLDWDPNLENGTFVTSGPFIFQEHIPGEQITLVANEFYPFRDKPNITTSTSTTDSIHPPFDINNFLRNLNQLLSNSYGILLGVALVTALVALVWTIKKFELWK